jgi:hypothetical protein
VALNVQFTGGKVLKMVILLKSIRFGVDKHSIRKQGKNGGRLVIVPPRQKRTGRPAKRVIYVG